LLTNIINVVVCQIFPDIKKKQGLKSLPAESRGF
jgi:hypothetical protein